MKSNVSMSLKKKMIRKYIRSVVTYDSEAWTINTDVRNKTNAFECWVYRRVLKMKKFFGHICRVSSGNDILTILEGRLDGIRSPGAQRRKWTDDAKDWFYITDYGSLKKVSEDRETWKLFIDNLHLLQSSP